MVVVGYIPKTPQPYVTWKAYAHTQFRYFASGNYFGGLDHAQEDFQRRVAEVRENCNLPAKRYKSPNRSGMER